MAVDEWVVILVDEAYALVRDSSCVPEIVVLSLVHQTEYLAFKSPKFMLNKDLHEVVSLKTFSKFDKKVKIKTILARLYTTPT